MQYEAVCVFHPELKEEKIESILKKFQDKIKGSGGTVDDVIKWGLKRLAFTPTQDKSIKEGFYVLLNFKGEGKTPVDLTAQMKVTEGLIRHMITRIEEKKVKGKSKGKRNEKVEIDPSMIASGDAGKKE